MHVHRSRMVLLDDTIHNKENSWLTFIKIHYIIKNWFNYEEKKTTYNVYFNFYSSKSATLVYWCVIFQYIVSLWWLTYDILSHYILKKIWIRWIRKLLDKIMLYSPTIFKRLNIFLIKFWSQILTEFLLSSWTFDIIHQIQALAWAITDALFFYICNNYLWSDVQEQI